MVDTQKTTICLTWELYYLKVAGIANREPHCQAPEADQSVWRERSQSFGRCGRWWVHHAECWSSSSQCPRSEEVESFVDEACLARMQAAQLWCSQCCLWLQVIFWLYAIRGTSVYIQNGASIKTHGFGKIKVLTVLASGFGFWIFL